MLPITILTGFLGSGKTTILGRILTRPEFAHTAIIINEFGSVGLDHELITIGEDTTITLSTGCLCCVIRDNLAKTIIDLIAQRRCGKLPAFQHIMIETSGLADPGPVLQLIATDAELADHVRLSCVVTVIDALLGPKTFAQHPLAVKQAAIADVIVITKTDLATSSITKIDEIVDAINPFAKRIIATHGIDSIANAIANTTSHGHGQAGQQSFTSGTNLRESPMSPLHGDVHYFSILRDEPIGTAALTLFLELLAEQCSQDLFRMKGIVGITEATDTPAIIHATHNVFQFPGFLPKWPSAERHTRIVFIAKNIRKRWVEAILHAIECEVSYSKNNSEQ